LHHARNETSQILYHFNREMVSAIGKKKSLEKSLNHQKGKTVFKYVSIFSDMTHGSKSSGYSTPGNGNSQGKYARTSHCSAPDDIAIIVCTVSNIPGIPIINLNFSQDSNQVTRYTVIVVLTTHNNHNSTNDNTGSEYSQSRTHSNGSSNYDHSHRKCIDFLACLLCGKSICKVVLARYVSYDKRLRE